LNHPFPAQAGTPLEAPVNDYEASATAARWEVETTLMPAMFGERLVAACGSWHAKLDRTLHTEVFRRQEATRRELDHYKTKLEPMRLEKEKRDLTRLREQKKLGKAAARTLGMAAQDPSAAGRAADEKYARNAVKMERAQAAYEDATAASMRAIDAGVDGRWVELGAVVTALLELELSLPHQHDACSAGLGAVETVLEAPEATPLEERLRAAAAIPERDDLPPPPPDTPATPAGKGLESPPPSPPSPPSPPLEPAVVAEPPVAEPEPEFEPEPEPAVAEPEPEPPVAEPEPEFEPEPEPAVAEPEPEPPVAEPEPEPPVAEPEPEPELEPEPVAAEPEPEPAEPEPEAAPPPALPPRSPPALPPRPDAAPELPAREEACCAAAEEPAAPAPLDEPMDDDSEDEDVAVEYPL